MEHITITEALKILSVSRPTLCEWCDSGRISAIKVPDSSKAKFHWEISKDDCFKKKKEISLKNELKAEEKREVFEKETNEKGTNEILDIDEVEEGDSYEKEELKIDFSEGDRSSLYNSLRKVDAEKILKIEQALAKQKDNMFKSGILVVKADVEKQISFVFSEFSRNLKDLVVLWQKKYFLSQSVADGMQRDLVECIAKMLEKWKEESK